VHIPSINFCTVLGQDLTEIDAEEKRNTCGVGVHGQVMGGHGGYLALKDVWIDIGRVQGMNGERSGIFPNLSIKRTGKSQGSPAGGFNSEHAGEGVSCGNLDHRVTLPILGRSL
jgi:hypothetical protein